MYLRKIRNLQYQFVSQLLYISAQWYKYQNAKGCEKFKNSDLLQKTLEICFYWFAVDYMYYFEF